MLKALLNYRGFVLTSIRNEFFSRFAQSRLGGLWMIIHPLAQVTIFTLVLSNVLAAKLPGIESQHAYPLYLMAGTLCWSLFSEIVSRCLNLFIENGNLLKKMNFPRITLPIIAVGSCLTNHLFLLVSVFVIFALLGHPPGLLALWVPVLTVTVACLAVSVGLILGILNVFMRDIGQIVPVILQILYWLTPIVYPITTLPPQYERWLDRNPLFPLVSAYQRVLVYDTSPDVSRLWPILLGALILLLIGLGLFRRASPELVDSL